jgi:hypothetical protein
MATISGTAVNFGFTNTSGGVTITSPAVFTGRILLQSADQIQGAERESTRDEGGAIVSEAFYDPHQKATLEWVIKGSGLADVITGTTLTGIGPGTFVTISACANMPDLVATTWYIVGEPKIAGTNVNVKRVTLNLEKRAGITGPAPA